MSFKTNNPDSTSKKEKFEGAFHELIELASERFDQEILPLMAMSYTRTQFIIPDNPDIRATVDEKYYFL